MFELKVIKKFQGKAEGKILSPGDVVKTDDLQRVNALVGRGYCEITAVEAPEPAKEDPKEDKGAKGGKKE